MEKHEHEYERGAHMRAAFDVDGRRFACAICGEYKPEKRPRLNFHDFDDTTMATIGSGHYCVLLMIRNLDWYRSGQDSIVLRPDNARALASGLIAMARQSEDNKHFENCGCNLESDNAAK